MISSKFKLSCNNIKLVVAAKTGSREKIIAVVIVLTNFWAQTVIKKQSNVPKKPRYNTLFKTNGEKLISVWLIPLLIINPKKEMIVANRNW